jgi:glyoxylate reductase
MEMAEILITRAFPEEIVAPYAARFDVEQGAQGAYMPRADLLSKVGDVRALVSYGADAIDDELLEAGTNLRIVANFGVGYDSIDVPAATSRGIWISNTPDVLTDSTADVALLLLLATLRRAAEGFDQVRQGRWSSVDPDALWGRDPSELVLGIYGLGRIGRALARRVAPLGMRVIYHNRTRLPDAIEAEAGATWVSFDELLETCDVLSVHVPLTPETRGRIGSRELAQMKPGSFVVNAARGPIFDQDALIAALQSEHLAGVGLDVFTGEPAVPEVLATHPHAFLLPHIGSATRRTRAAMMRLCLDNAAAVLDGRPPVTPVNQVIGSSR